MTNATAVIALTYRGTDIQEAFSDSAWMYLEIVKGWNEPASVRGTDLIVPSLAGRLVGTRVKDIVSVQLEGLVVGATGATAVSTYLAKVVTFRALFDPTLTGSIVATPTGAAAKTLTNCRTMSVAWDPISAYAARVNVLLESTSPDWA